MSKKFKVEYPSTPEAVEALLTGKPNKARLAMLGMSGQEVRPVLGAVSLDSPFDTQRAAIKVAAETVANSMDKQQKAKSN